MSISAFFRGALLGALLAGAGGLAYAQSDVSPRQIQDQIANGQTGTALNELHQVLQTHPGSGVAWYLTAEAQDAAGNESAARHALAQAQHFAPGLPFAKPADVAALQAHLAQAGAGADPVHHGISPVWWIIGGFVLLFILLRAFGRRRRVMPGYQPGYDGYGNRQGPFPYGPNGPGGPGGPAYGPGPGMQGPGVGSSLLTGLAAGAGFAAGERIIDDLDGANRGREFGQGPNFDQGQNYDPTPPDRDDGLQGSPDWNGGGDDDFDPNNNW